MLACSLVLYRVTILLFLVYIYVCKEDQKDMSESDEESVVSTKRTYGSGKDIFGKYDPDKLVEDDPTDNSTDEDTRE